MARLHRGVAGAAVLLVIVVELAVENIQQA